MVQAPDPDRVSQALANLDAQTRSPGSLDALDLSRILYRAASELVDTTGFYLALYDAQSGMIEVVRQMANGAELPGGAFPLGSGFTSQVIRSRQPQLIQEWSRHGPHVQVQVATDRSGLPESGITVPIIGPVGHEVLGVLAAQSYAPAAYTEADVATLERVASVAGRVIEVWRRRARAQADLTRRSTELEAVLASMSEGLIITDASGAVVRFNAAARSLLVSPSDWIVFRQPLDAPRDNPPIAERSIGHALATLVGALRQGQARQDVEVAVVREGRERVLSLSASPMREPPGGVIVIRDVTEQRALDRLKAQVLQIASHDLQAPLTVVKGQAQYLDMQLKNGTATEAGLHQGLVRIVSQTERVSHMMRLLLDLSRMEGGRLEIQPSPTDLIPLVHEVVDGTRLLTTTHEIAVEAPASVVGNWDAQRLRQVLQNLLTNAVKYSPDGGRIDVHVRLDDDAVRVDITDTGIGLSAEDAGRVFGQFYRAEGARRLEGSGLGLYICQAIVSAHGGRISVSSPGPGKGSTFSFTLPATLSLDGPSPL
jgi:two-component system phosphate regulon sensor histidine kinase PhoR